MNRLRVRVELNRRKAGVPMEELVSVVDETRKFFKLLSQDVQIEPGRGDWLASNFDPESLNFTAEYEGLTSEEQVRAFGSAFSGTTSLRRETIAQFTRIAEFIGEDEQVGFGLYQSDQETEPSDWRCLSRRDALRFSEEIQLLAKATGESEPATPLPAVNGSVGGRRLFKDQRERTALAVDPARSVRELESSLSKRIGLLESKVEAHAHNIQDLDRSRDVADERFVKLLGAMESFWTQAPRQLSAPAQESALSTGLPTLEAMRVQPTKSSRWGTFGLVAGATALLVVAAKYPELTHRAVGSSPSVGITRAAEPATAITTHPDGAVVNPQIAEVSRVPSVLEESAVVMPHSQAQTSASEPVRAQVQSAPEPAPVPTKLVKTAAAPRVAPTAEITHQVSLEIPAELRSTIDSRVVVNVAVGIDPEGKVTSAEVSSTEGAGADQLTEQSLKVARWFRFRPTGQGKKAVASQTVLSFVFEPDANAQAADLR